MGLAAGSEIDLRDSVLSLGRWGAGWVCQQRSGSSPVQWCEQDLLVEAKRENLLNLECFPRQPSLRSWVHGAFRGRRDRRMWYLARVKPGELVYSANGSRDFFFPHFSL